MKPVRLMIARFPFGRSEDPDVCDWVTSTVITARHDPRIFEILRWRKDDTPITLSRNACFEAAHASEVDFLMMVDSDMSPDIHLESNPFAQPPIEPFAKPFFETSLEFLWQQRQAGIPSVIGAPYCGPPPCENVYVFQWATQANSLEDEPDMRLAQYSREEAANMRGVQPCAALPTGLIMFDMDCLAKIDRPYTYYEWGDDAASIKASTEDVTLTRDLALGGAPQFCNWDAWAGHWKWKCVCKPIFLTSEMVSEKFRQRILKEAGVSNGNDKKEEKKLLIPPEYIRVSPARQPTPVSGSGSPGCGEEREPGGGGDKPADSDGHPAGSQDARLSRRYPPGSGRADHGLLGRPG